MKDYTGPYKYKDSDPDSIDAVRYYQMMDLKGFKGSKQTYTEWLMKENAVRQKTDAPYQRFKSGGDV